MLTIIVIVIVIGLVAILNVVAIIAIATVAIIFNTTIHLGRFHHANQNIGLSSRQKIHTIDMYLRIHGCR